MLLYGPDGIFIGERVIEFFNNIKINIAFFGILAINFKNGWMVSSSFEAELVRKVVSLSNETIGIMDSSKFNNTSFAKVGPINLLNEIITDPRFINAVHIFYRNICLHGRAILKIQ